VGDGLSVFACPEYAQAGLTSQDLQAQAWMIRRSGPMALPAVVDLSIDVDEDARSCH